MKLAWYRGIEPILAMDACYSVNHVAVFRLINSKITPPNTKTNTVKPNHTKKISSFIMDLI